MINAHENNPIVKATGCGAVLGTTGAAIGAAKELVAITSLKHSAMTAKDYFVPTAKNSMRILDPKGMILKSAKKAGLIGLAVALGISASKYFKEQQLIQQYKMPQ